jgi:hypothetical protein
MTRICAGIIIWGVHFAVIYGYTGLACARRPTHARFVEWVSGWVAAFALLAMVLEAIAVLWVPVCG